jgi:hypothetical protein
MLSFLYRLIHSFRAEHGFAPNVVYLNQHHYRALCENLPTLGHEQMERFLEVQIVLMSETSHPRALWQEQAHRAAGGF